LRYTSQHCKPGHRSLFPFEPECHAAIAEVGDKAVEQDVLVEAVEGKDAQSACIGACPSRTVDQETDAYAAYASVDYDFNERWMLTLGLRYSDEETDFKGGTDATIVDSEAFDAFVGAPLGIPNGTTIPFETRLATDPVGHVIIQRIHVTGH